MLSEDPSQLRASGILWHHMSTLRTSRILWHCTSTCKQLLALLNHVAATLVCEEKEEDDEEEQDGSRGQRTPVPP